jgi:hypothetical protein
VRVSLRSEPAPSSPDRIVSPYYPVGVAATGKLAGFFVCADHLLIQLNAPRGQGTAGLLPPYAMVHRLSQWRRPYKAATNRKEPRHDR